MIREIIAIARSVGAQLVRLRFAGSFHLIAAAFRFLVVN